MDISLSKKVRDMGDRGTNPRTYNYQGHYIFNH